MAGTFDDLDSLPSYMLDTPTSYTIPNPLRESGFSPGSGVNSPLPERVKPSNAQRKSWPVLEVVASGQSQVVDLHRVPGKTTQSEIGVQPSPIGRLTPRSAHFECALCSLKYVVRFAQTLNNVTRVTQ